jgi:predicted MPP superfamily phosphohydrolase
MLDLFLRNLPDLIVLSIVIWIQFIGARWILNGPARSSSPWIRWTVMVFAAFSFVAVALAISLRAARVARFFPPWFLSWGRALFVIWSLLSVYLFAATLVSQLFRSRIDRTSPGRRRFLKTIRATLFAAPAAVIGYGTFVERTTIRMREQTIPIPGLHPDLDGLRLVQLSDIHMSPFLTLRELERAIDLANETKAHVALVTGDLITGRGDPIDTCMNALTRLRSDAGTYGCLGNHEVYAGIEGYVTERGLRMAMRFLRLESAPLNFGSGAINLAGVDYQTKRYPYLIGADVLVKSGVCNILLSHNPDVFPVAARMGYDLTISGHTHGGQVRVEILREDLNIARFFTPFVDGLYRRPNSSVFVTRGIGTIVLPARLGSPPEVALLTLKAEPRGDTSGAA